MGRQHTIKNHPQINRINTMISDGIPYSVIAHEVQVPRSTLARYALSSKSELTKIIDDEPGAVEVLTRLVEVAEHARDIRRQSKLSGSPVAQSRAIKGEADVLARLLSELAIDDLSIIDVLNDTKAIAMGIRLFARTYPESAADLAEALAKNSDTRDFAKALRAQIEMKHE